jgi:[acyl-carrier-protein] S-malonyltransferase
MFGAFPASSGMSLIWFGIRPMLDSGIRIVVSKPASAPLPYRPKHGSTMTIAFTFPGQGSQAVGMGKAFAEQSPEAAAVFAEVDAALGEPLARLIWDGPLERLTLTEHAQPALMTVSIAVLRLLEARGVNLAHDVAFVAGHSLGEYSALTAAGSLSLADAATLLRTRGQAMQAAVPVGEGAMAALLGIDAEGAARAAADGARAAGAGMICGVANDNDPGQVVISGHRLAVERAGEAAKTYGAKRALMLNVSAPFHCALMRPAADAMRMALAAIALLPPTVPLVANVSAAPERDPARIKDLLVEQVTGTVRWRQSIAAMAAAGVTTFYEVGAGKVLTGMVKRIAAEAEGKALVTLDDIDIAAAAIVAGRI